MTHPDSGVELNGGERIKILIFIRKYLRIFLILGLFYLKENVCIKADVCFYVR